MGKFINELVLCRVRTNDICLPYVGLPVLKNRTQVKKYDVVVLYRSDRRIIGKYC